ncbi:succinate dehydrogenase [Rhodophyticola sp. CCM32]|uniref:succinate dehydrogenase n=1 Tax=Rhodophyticola sp. CCM32 TaxID=2916397 RepID=UPI00107F6C53|nr:succinate dehydrogenase [Rhodophyticola sp. CCM32]QBX99638.1 succinate dehydrogenase [Rhodophyticola sp. CCM32]
MTRTIFISLLVLTLTACNLAQDTANTIARDQARGVINGIVAERFPGINAAPVTDCVVDNASAQEILTVARAALVGVTDQTVTTVTGILQRPDTVRCIAENALTSLEDFA